MRTEFGYWVYTRVLDNSMAYIFPAIILDGERKVEKKYPGYGMSFSRAQIESYAQDILDIGNKVEEEISREFGLLVHDLRHLSTSIYHAAEEGKKLIDGKNFHDAKEKFENIIGSQSMLKIRTDVLDYSGNLGEFGDIVSVPVYRRIDKVIKSFSPIAWRKGIRIHKEGTSYAESRGPNAADVIGYVIIDNAIKYSPRNNDITVKFSETKDSIVVERSSVGPVIAPDELAPIFMRGYRGAFAVSSGISGTGVGLALAKQLTEQFKGRIEVSTGEKEYVIDGNRMVDVSFCMTFPIHVEANKRKPRKIFGFKLGYKL